MLLTISLHLDLQVPHHLALRPVFRVGKVDRLLLPLRIVHIDALAQARCGGRGRVPVSIAPVSRLAGLVAREGEGAAGVVAIGDTVAGTGELGLRARPTESSDRQDRPVSRRRGAPS